jgi:hypothetical protein
MPGPRCPPVFVLRNFPGRVLAEKHADGRATIDRPPVQASVVLENNFHRTPRLKHRVLVDDNIDLAGKEKGFRRRRQVMADEEEILFDSPLGQALDDFVIALGNVVNSANVMMARQGRGYALSGHLPLIKVVDLNRHVAAGKVLGQDIAETLPASLLIDQNKDAVVVDESGLPIGGLARTRVLDALLNRSSN